MAFRCHLQNLPPHPSSNCSLFVLVSVLSAQRSTVRRRDVRVRSPSRRKRMTARENLRQPPPCTIGHGILGRGGASRVVAGVLARSLLPRDGSPRVCPRRRAVMGSVNPTIACPGHGHCRGTIGPKQGRQCRHRRPEAAAWERIWTPDPAGAPDMRPPSRNTNPGALPLHRPGRLRARGQSCVRTCDGILQRFQIDTNRSAVAGQGH